MKLFKLAVLILLLSGPAWAQSPEYVFVFLNNKPDKAKLADEEVKKSWTAIWRISLALQRKIN